MPPTTNQLPTLGYHHKIVCECLGLWNSDNDDVSFNVEATEKERRAALRQAFEAIKKENGKYGSHDELIAVTTQLAPKDTQKVKKSKTIQTYVNHLAKTDFESIDEYLELRQYIEVLLTERYFSWGISELAISFYRSALAYYREFVREYACNAQSQLHSYLFFTSQNLRLLAVTLTQELLPNDMWPDAGRDDSWPLKVFADQACQITGISLYKLHQYHEFQQEGPLNELAWARDFTSQQVNTRSKQVIDRLRKHSRMKWETFYPTLQPLTYHLPTGCDEKAFPLHAFAAMLAHNINVHVANCGSFVPPAINSLVHDQAEYGHAIPSSDLLEMLINDYPIDREAIAPEASKRYQALLDDIRSFPGSLKLKHAFEMPNSLGLFYEKEHRQFIEGSWLESLVNSPNWLNEWFLAREAVSAGDTVLALEHFKTALDQAKYASGPLFIPFYIQVCAFCKSQYQQYSKRNEEELFERFYEVLGANASKYAALVGYTPVYMRDRETLMPRSMLPEKTKLIFSETNRLADMWLS